MTVPPPVASDKTANRRRLRQTLRDLAVLLSAAGIVALLFGGIHLLQANTTTKWPTTSGIILSAGAETVAIPGRAIRYIQAVIITYTYEVEGESYTGSGINRDTVPVEAGTAEADRLLAAYPAGSAVSVSYDPADPSVAVLETAVPAGQFVPGLVLLGLAAVVGLVVLLIRS